MDIRQYQKTGSHHRRAGSPCQDRIRRWKGESLAMAAVADGVSSAAWSDEGAALACRAAEDIFRQMGGELWDYPPRKLSYLLAEHVLYFLEKNTGCRGEALRDYASTMAVVFADLKNSCALAVSLGDCGIYEIRATGLRPVLPPVRHEGRPCQTTTENAWEEIRVQRLELQPGQRLLLCTDGFWDEALQGEKGPDLRQLLRSGDDAGCADMVDGMALQDDCSFVTMTVREEDLV